MAKRAPVAVTMTAYRHADQWFEGWCVSCEDFTRPMTEGDARGYDCDDCLSDDTVFGASEALIMGAIEVME